MAITFDAGASGEDESVVTTIDLNFTPGAGGDMVIVCEHIVRTGGKTSVSVTYDPSGSAAAFTQITAIEGPDTAYTYEMAAWILKDADIVKSTTKIIQAATEAGGAFQGIAAGSFTGVDQTTPNDSAQTNEDYTSSPTTALAITSAVDDMVIGTEFMEGTDPTPVDGTNFDAGLPITTSGIRWTASYWAGASSVDVKFSYTGSRRWSQIGFNLNAAAATAGGIRNPIGGPTVLRNPLGAQ